MQPRHIPVASLALLLATPAVRADAIVDFQAGTAVTLRTVTVDLAGGPRSSTASGPIRKPAGTLDLELPASALGVDLPVTLHLRATVGADHRITYAVDEIYPRPIDLGGGVTLARVTGRIAMRAAPLPGTARPDVGNVRLEIAGPSSLTASGSWGEVAIALDRLELVGGVVQPGLATVADPGGATICSDRVATSHDFEVSLADLAAGSGATVDVGTAGSAGVHVPSAVVVRPGRRSARVPARIAAGFVGTARLTAAAGGRSGSLDVAVRPHADCARR